MANDVRDRVAADLSHTSVWQMKLLVALAYFKTADEVSRQAAAEIGAPVLIEELLDLVEREPTTAAFRSALVRLALARTPVSIQAFEALTEEISDLEREVIKVCLSEAQDGRIVLHPLVRQGVIKRERDMRSWDADTPWTI